MIKSASTFDLVRLIDVEPVAFCVLLVPREDRSVVEDLRQELSIQTGSALLAIEKDEGGLDNVLERVRTAAEPVVVISGLEKWSDHDFSALDINRSRLETGAFVIFAVDLETAARLLDRAPNLRSIIGANVFIWAPDAARMLPGEIDVRLQQLRDHYGKSDDEILSEASAGALSPEPQFVEWLILLGRGDLVR